MGEQIIFGFHVNVVDETLALHKPNIDGPRRLVAETHFNPGNVMVPTKSLQELRDNVTRWSKCNDLWRLLAVPLDGLLGF